MTRHQPALPLTGAQEGIWFAHHLDPANPIYTTGARVDIDGPLAGDVLAAAIHETVEETEALHVRFVVRDGQPRQVPLGPDERSPWAVARVDLRAEPDPEAAAQAWIEDALAAPSDLHEGPRFSQALLRLGEEHHVWFHRYHQVVMDAYGFSLIARRVATIYGARLAFDTVPPTRAGSLAELVAADGEARRLAGEADRDFWTERFPGPPEPATLAGTTARVTGTRRRRSSTLPPEVVVRMEAAADRAKGHWPEMVLAAVALYLHRLSDAPDVVLGVPMMGRLGRPGAPAARTPGMLVNIVPLRVAPRPTTTVRGLVADVVAELAAVRAHQHHRFEDLRRDLRLDAAEGPRGEAALVGPWVNVRPAELLRFGARTTGVARPVSGGPVHDLAVHVQRLPDGGLALDVDANPATYDVAALESHHAHLDALLRTLTAAPPDRLVAAVPLLDADERAAAVAAGRGTAPATGDLTTLLGPADGLAGRLRDAGAGPGTVVAVALPPGPELDRAARAVLQAGASVLPVDVDAPAARLAPLLAETAPVLGVAATPDALPGVRTIAVDGVAADAGEVLAVDDAHPALVLPVPAGRRRPVGLVLSRAAARARLADGGTLWSAAPPRGSTTRVLDRALQDVPDGAAGELYVGGAGLADGYLGQPALTATRFVADPAGAPGARMVRTGERVRRDGTPVGRLDGLLTVGGQVVEPGEVGAALEGLDGVAQAVVSVREGQLVAHVVGQVPDDLRARVAAVLPAALVPSAVVVVDDFPRTADGRVDTARLPAPAARTEPEDRTQERLCAVVAEVLGLESVGPDDDFFALGGHSLLAMRLMSRVGEELGVTPTVRDVFDAPTPAALADLLGTRLTPTRVLRGDEAVPAP
ncbi:AMP-binding enzyme [Actinomycetospora succinea]|uniref:AMP-binding enzyme n=1 Tax=Actinomycetospora succinea TaxID=663603 RepID=A0A4R6VPS9_9PSEU|nr:condensation domain-containing protein [Actinomycetospora succinea]TDQ65331.1 AMP-binding enzyme [Actinomycetospora succinea]